jgi:FtsP/CotA-like multicopper oxidase with cupredoxin domain
MKIATLRSVATVVGWLLLAACCVQAATLQAIPEVLPDASGTTSVTLTVDAARLTIDGAVTFTTRAYYWAGVARVHGPTLILQAGGRLNITLINNLVDDSANDVGRAHNTFRHANTTNIHTHGLHVDPAIDSIFRLASPGTSLNYDIPIPADHAPGMHWYHSHAHGSSSLLVMGGLLGGMYMRPQTKDNIPAALSALTTTRIVMQMFNFAPQTDNTGAVVQSCTPLRPEPYDPFKFFAFSELESEIGSLLLSNPSYAGSDRTFVTINGQYQPTVAVAPGESRLFQIVYGAATRMPLISFPSGCVAQQIAFDGIHFTTARTVTYIQMVTGTRAEFVLTCASAGTYAITYVINGNVDNVRTTGGTTLFTVVASGTTVTSATLPSPLNITRPSYLSDLRGLASTDVSMHLGMAQGGAGNCTFWMAHGSNCTTVGAPGGGNGPTSTTCIASHFAGQKFTNDSSVYTNKMRVGQTAEWTIWAGGNNAHPLHIHVNHFQIQGWVGLDSIVGHWVTIGDWRDTMAIATSAIKIRFAAHYYAGETVIHCHELVHEDRGLMDTFLIMPALDSVTTTAAPTTTTTSGTTPTPISGGTSAPSSPATPVFVIGHLVMATVMLTALFCLF